MVVLTFTEYVASCDPVAVGMFALHTGYRNGTCILL